MEDIEFYFHDLFKLLFSLNFSLPDPANWTDNDFCAVSLIFQRNCTACGEAESTERRPAGGADQDVCWDFFFVDRVKVSIIFTLKQKISRFTSYTV